MTFLLRDSSRDNLTYAQSSSESAQRGNWWGKRHDACVGRLRYEEDWQGLAME